VQVPAGAARRARRSLPRREGPGAHSGGAEGQALTPTARGPRRALRRRGGPGARSGGAKGQALTPTARGPRRALRRRGGPGAHSGGAKGQARTPTARRTQPPLRRAKGPGPRSSARRTRAENPWGRDNSQVGMTLMAHPDTPTVYSARWTPPTHGPGMGGGMISLESTVPVAVGQLISNCPGSRRSGPPSTLCCRETGRGWHTPPRPSAVPTTETANDFDMTWSTRRRGTPRRTDRYFA
jgi:hypothetical protein